MPQSRIRVSGEVQTALDEGRPVVALESTIFTHGLPRPRNVDVARRGIEVAKANGAVAATVGVVRGQPVVGLSEAEIDELAYDDDAEKISVRELSTAGLKSVNGGTTIAATTFLAHQVGIQVFSTGGLGGVHHGASTSFDESADMITLARTPIVLVSSGAKAILDVGATLERFETLSIPVIGYNTRTYPGFYVTDSEFEISQEVRTPQDVAAIFRAQAEFGLEAAVLVANPVPRDQQLDPAELDRVLEGAWHAAEEQGIKGQATTPFLLDYIRIHTDERSLDANVALYLHNIEVGSRIAGELARSA